VRTRWTIRTGNTTAARARTGWDYSPSVRTRDYLVEPTAASSCRFSWTIAIEPYALTRVADPANRLLLSTLLSDTHRHYGLR
jgi:hypothetical protein